MAMFSYSGETKSSEFHKSCIPASARQAACGAAQLGKETPGGALVDVVKDDLLWRQRIQNETLRTNEWKENWGFMTEIDPKGNVKPPASALPDKLNMFSAVVSNTSSGLYGARLDRPTAQHMMAMQFVFQNNKRRLKLGPEMLCY